MERETRMRRSGVRRRLKPSAQYGTTSLSGALGRSQRSRERRGKPAFAPASASTAIQTMRPCEVSSCFRAVALLPGRGAKLRSRVHRGGGRSLPEILA